MPLLKRLNSKTVIVADTDSELVSSAHIIEDEGSELSQRARLNFVGDAVTVTDDSGNNRTVVTITGGGSQVTTDEDGNVCINLNPVATPFVLESPDTTKWDVTVNTSGNLVATSGATGDAVLYTLKRPDLTEVQLKVTNGGVLQLDETLDVGTELQTSLFLKDTNDVYWKLGATDLNQLTTSSTESLTNAFKVVDGAGQTIFQVQEEETGGGQVYFPVYNAASLPASPTSVSGMQPFASYDDTVNIRPIYFDVVWKYAHDNSNV